MGLIVYETNYPVLHEISIVNCVLIQLFYEPSTDLHENICYKVQDLISTMHFYEMGKM